MSRFIFVGRFTFRSDKVVEAIESSKCVALRYLDPQDEPTQHYPFNPNGSQGKFTLYLL